MDQNVSTSQALLSESVNQAVDDTALSTDSVEGLIEAAYLKFLNNKLDDFPRMCEVARIQNKIKLDEMREHGFSGQYEQSSIGWSKGHEFKWEFDIPTDLYVFMTNMVYKDFWSDSNKKVWRSFMNAVCRGDDAKELLIKTKMVYGSNKDGSLTR